MSNVRVCVDVVGGDEKPQVVLDGIEAALAADPNIEVLAAGPAEIVNPFAASHARVEALEAPDVIAMDDDPIRAVMTKRKSSIVLSCRAIKKGNADAFFSAGNTASPDSVSRARISLFLNLLIPFNPFSLATSFNSSRDIFAKSSCINK